MFDDEREINELGISELVVSVPYMLGFFPQDVVIVIPCRESYPLHLNLAVRMDLSDLLSAAVRPEQLLSAVTGRGWDLVVLLVVGGGCRPDRDGLPHRSLVARFSELLVQRGIAVACSLWVPEIREGIEWIRYCDIPVATGRLGDPRVCQMAALAVTEGRVTYDRVQDFLDAFKPDDEVALDRRLALLAHLDMPRQASTDPSTEAFYASMDLVDNAVQAAGQGTLPNDDPDIVGLATALADPLVWTTSVRFAYTKDWLAAVQLWLHLTRSLPDRHRVESAALLAITAGLNGETELARLAARHATEADSDREIVTCFVDPLQYGVFPSWMSGVLRYLAKKAIKHVLESVGELTD
ncbi:MULTISPECIES: DUF4192 domain-containing protein [unclassified Crossiella]|uniref:DUF4192 domain-containing protein n=1 Tax=unclassified Crossiella TaxID=2620835 RepID=UPI001FFF960B|nr:MULTISPECIES: DUF4192 domain-containing protein [unclassified Crossiella]MCK2240974.1 DUF4192 domain-containing protein [Crossiella sp. S99.2]MCK2253882.1 DUF4192 domain-containing protein [Crossiella sp. S99.1]